MSDVIDETTVRRLDGVSTPVQQVPLGGHQRARGFRDGIVAAAVVTVLALAGGIIGFPALQGGASPSPAPSTGSGQPTASASPTATPRVVAVATPHFDCRAAAPGAEPVATLQAERRTLGARITSPDPVADPSVLATIPIVGVASGTRLELATGFRRCALAWNISFGARSLSVRQNPTLDPAYAAENIFDFSLATSVPTSDLLLARLDFGDGPVTFAWRLEVEPHPAPEIRIQTVIPVNGGYDQGSIAMTPGCGLITSFEFGASVVPDRCTNELPLDVLPTLAAAPLAPVNVVASDELIRSTDPSRDVIQCGTIDPQAREFHADLRCDLRYLFEQGLSFDLPLTPDIWVLRLDACVHDAVATTCGTWWAIVDTASPGWTPLPGLQ